MTTLVHKPKTFRHSKLAADIWLFFLIFMIVFESAMGLMYIIAESYLAGSVFFFLAFTMTMILYNTVNIYRTQLDRTQESLVNKTSAYDKMLEATIKSNRLWGDSTRALDAAVRELEASTKLLKESNATINKLTERIAQLKSELAMKSELLEDRYETCRE